MKKCIIAVAAICLLTISAYADYECDSKYASLIKKVESFSQTEMSEENRNRYLTELKKAHQLCEEGKKEQAAEIFEELRKDKDFDMVFSTHDGN